MVETDKLMGKIKGRTKSFPYACQLAKGVYNGGHIDSTEERNDVSTKLEACSTA